MHILGLCGAYGAGKDYVCSLIKKILGPDRVERVAFADPLKDSVAVMLGIPRKAMDEDKNAKTTWRWRDLSPALVAQLHSIPAEKLHEFMSIREVLQVFGTEFGRNCWSQNIWLRAWQARAEASKADLVIATDCRFKNEIEAVRGMRGKVWRILGGKQGDNHVSEQEWRDLSPDFLISNEGQPAERSLAIEVALALSKTRWNGFDEDALSARLREIYP
ncbi:MAG: hypothetical protein HS116_25005 [Planctomycetes bacterium]|nr:hypothetical protein [Planctomycetota bacterium]